SQFLPESLSEDETRQVVRRTIAEVGADDPKMKGQVIGAVMQSAEGVDGALVARIVGEELDVSNK
ncbi:MAG: GatB/YqeY domain-containing protein, partial [Acidimicrobiia bacterium]